MKRGPIHKGKSDDSGVATMIEYLMVSGTLVALFVVMLLLINSNFIDTPLSTITYHSFTDIGNGLSTRIVDVYSIAPNNGDLQTNFDLPDEIGGRGYFIQISGDASGQTVDISRDSIVTHVAMAGIGASKHGTAGGNTTGAGVNKISYDSGGF